MACRRCRVGSGRLRPAPWAPRRATRAGCRQGAHSADRSSARSASGRWPTPVTAPDTTAPAAAPATAARAAGSPADAATASSRPPRRRPPAHPGSGRRLRRSRATPSSSTWPVNRGKADRKTSSRAPEDISRVTSMGAATNTGGTPGRRCRLCNTSVARLKDLWLPADVGGSQSYVVELADSQPPDVEARVELGHRQRHLAAVQPDVQGAADHQSLDGHEQRPVGHRGP